MDREAPSLPFNSCLLLELLRRHGKCVTSVPPCVSKGSMATQTHNQPVLDFPTIAYLFINFIIQQLLKDPSPENKIFYVVFNRNFL